jgi:transposase, IS5 family
MVSRYPHAHQFKRANRALKFLRTRLGRLIRDITRKISGDPALAERLAPPRALAVRVRFQTQRQRGPKVYSLRAPEVECKGKARAPTSSAARFRSRSPVLHAKALHGNPFDGHTLNGALADVERNTGVEVRRIPVDKGYRGHRYPNRFRVFISGQVRRTTAAVKREMKRRAAVEPVIGRLKADHRMDRNYLKGQDGDRINAVLAAAGFNFHLLLRWLAALLRPIFLAALQSLVSPQPA